ncbi:carboxylate--amine ligase [Planococcus sp. N028]|uniref:Carboxylate--amine ligase n=1 Tax=Planococcus shixiaomingii TaxID=3058393 RepID=A0ABT8MXA0_9BACL|nr:MULTISPECIES: carboxylate--amine ligase [unclassified Planococcus (in: firmicutes)]MDN7240271.1 carboxylate--amine ligase [Planococcus sp. N028]WKA56170.1 carboxylate--amine ligase [Planococcus sp. N022]
MKNLPFLPIIVGTDMNAYNMAISFHEAYGIKPILVGKEPLSFTALSTITETIELRSGLADSEQFADILIDISKKYKTTGKTLLLIGTNDLYVRLIIENAETLKAHFAFNYIDEDLMNQLQVKANFYKLCSEHGIDTPTTFFYDCSTAAPFNEEMMYPVIVKPSNGIAYNQNKFPGQQKVYKVENAEELQEVIGTITTSGYNDELIIQDYIPGDDTYMWDSVIYASSKGKTQLVTYAQVVLQEHTVTAIGNYTALITRYDENMMKKLQHFLEAVGYTGFANFDLKYDERDGKFKVFEVNIRQGRSSYYVTALGHNMASLFVDDLIYNVEKPVTYLNEEFLFTVVPKIVLRKFVDNKAVQQDINRLIKKGKYGNPLFYKKDKHLKRKFYLLARQVNYYKKYKNNQW